MAVTKGHGNPRWNREETILAFDLLIMKEGRVPPKSDEDLVALSKYLRGLPYHPIEKRNPTFRNVDGVAFKLGNLRSVITGTGLKNVSAMDREVVRDLGEDSGRVKQLAEAIRGARSLLTREDFPQEVDLEVSDEEAFFEGRMIWRLHRKRERNSSVRRRLLIERSRRGLSCEICELARPELAFWLQEAFFEAHHILPLHQSNLRVTKLNDMALLCANCHRAIHAMMIKEKQWIGLETAKARIHT